MSFRKPYVRATSNPDPDSWVAEFIAWWIGEDGYQSRRKLAMNDRIAAVRDNIP
jgi:Terminase large subunit, T4likevirus-type, N-terminal